MKQEQTAELADLNSSTVFRQAGFASCKTFRPKEQGSEEPGELFLEISDEGIQLSVKTARLTLEPIKQSDVAEFHKYIFGDAEVMEKFAAGNTRSLEQTSERVEAWSQRWKEGNPFSALVARTHSGEFIGMIVAGGGSEPGVSELAYLIRKDSWRLGYGSEMSSAVCKQLAAISRFHGLGPEGKQLSAIEATARNDNPGSVRILEKLGFEREQESEKFGALRGHFFRGVPDID